ncbi:hypothetical protein GOBAR_AA17326 [Gossypium barbadense]|uniref:Uncharacterized protein n=1 Tax=Gossypium barbadense TaxID=3634 RepID=A0A2P5XIZ4_GOSBA|nr:hypothetical protein GOBAR_AA17326 [Gossypium barbadense]
MKETHSSPDSNHVTEKPYACITMPEEIKRALILRVIQLPNFTYEFSIPSRLHRVCEAMEDSFFLPLHVLKVGFHLPLHSFFCNLLNNYRLALGQLSDASMGEVPKFSFFQHLYQLKGIDVGESAGFYYFFPHHKRLCIGRILALEEILTTRNVFRFFLKDFSLDGWRAGDNKKVARSVVVARGVGLQLGPHVSMLLARRKGVVTNYSIDRRVELIVEALLLRSPPSTLLFSRTCQPLPKRAPSLLFLRTLPLPLLVRTLQWFPQLKGCLLRLWSIFSNLYIAYYLRALTERLVMMEIKAEECGAELVVDKERCMTVEAELKKVTAGHFFKLERIIREYQKQVQGEPALHTQVACGSFDIRKVDFDTLTNVNVSSLGFDVCNPARSAWDSFVTTWKGEFFTEEGEGSSTVNLALSTVGEVMTSILPSVIGDVTITTPTVEYVAPIDED